MSFPLRFSPLLYFIPSLCHVLCFSHDCPVCFHSLLSFFVLFLVQPFFSCLFSSHLTFIFFLHTFIQPIFSPALLFFCPHPSNFCFTLLFLYPILSYFYPTFIRPQALFLLSFCHPISYLSYD